MKLPQQASEWPTTQEYDRALQARAKTVADPDIRNGLLLEDKTGPIHLGGGMVCVYKVGDWVVRCLRGNTPGDLAERYQAITAHLDGYMRFYGQPLEFLVPCTYVPRAIHIRGQEWPFIKLPYLKESLSLGSFLAEYRHERQVMFSLVRQWMDLATRLERAEIAHGDLDVTNVLVCGTPPDVAFKLVDYDAMYVPALQGRALTEDGHEHFQPAEQGLRQFNREMDRFSVLVIYLSLLALAKEPTLWEQCGADETSKLLIGSSDFRQPGVSRNFAVLEQVGIPGVNKCLATLRTALEQRQMPPSLEDVLARSNLQRAPTMSSVSPLRPRRPPVPVAGALPVMTPTQSTHTDYQSLRKSYTPPQAVSPVRPQLPIIPASVAMQQKNRRKPSRALLIWLIVGLGFIVMVALILTLVLVLR